MTRPHPEMCRGDARAAHSEHTVAVTADGARILTN
jgi:methionine aminopeptidase